MTRPTAIAHDRRRARASRRAPAAEHHPHEPADPVERRRALKRAGEADEGGELEQLRGVVGVHERTDQEGAVRGGEQAIDLLDAEDAMTEADHDGGDAGERRSRASPDAAPALTRAEVIGDEEGDERERGRPMCARVVGGSRLRGALVGVGARWREQCRPLGVEELARARSEAESTAAAEPARTRAARRRPGCAAGSALCGPRPTPTSAAPERHAAMSAMDERGGRRRPAAAPRRSRRGRPARCPTRPSNRGQAPRPRRNDCRRLRGLPVTCGRAALRRRVRRRRGRHRGEPSRWASVLR